jgi:hypothetical protein
MHMQLPGRNLAEAEAVAVAVAAYGLYLIMFLPVGRMFHYRLKQEMIRAV